MASKRGTRKDDGKTYRVQPFIFRDLDEPIARRRGVVGFEYSNELILVKLAAAGTASALKRVRDVRQVQKDVYKNEARLGEDGCFVFQLKGHAWSVVVDQHRREGLSAEAQRLSANLEGGVIYYRVRDCSSPGQGGMDYILYVDGTEEERFSYDTKHAYDDFQIKSTWRDSERISRDYDNPWDVVHGFFLELGALEPNVTFDTFVSEGTTDADGVLLLDERFTVFRRIEYLLLGA